MEFRLFLARSSMTDDEYTHEIVCQTGTIYVHLTDVKYYDTDVKVLRRNG